MPRKKSENIDETNYVERAERAVDMVTKWLYVFAKHARKAGLDPEKLEQVRTYLSQHIATAMRQVESGETSATTFRFSEE